MFRQASLACLGEANRVVPPGVDECIDGNGAPYLDAPIIRGRCCPQRRSIATGTSSFRARI